MPFVLSYLFVYLDASNFRFICTYETYGNVNVKLPRNWYLNFVQYISASGIPSNWGSFPSPSILILSICLNMLVSGWTIIKWWSPTLKIPCSQNNPLFLLLKHVHSYHPTTTPLGWLFPRLGHLWTCSVVFQPCYMCPIKCVHTFRGRCESNEVFETPKKVSTTVAFLPLSCFKSCIHALIQSIRVSSRFLCALQIWWLEIRRHTLFLKWLNNIRRMGAFFITYYLSF